MSFLIELWEFLKIRKKLWFLPIILSMLFLGTLIALSQTVLAPFIYTLF